MPAGPPADGPTTLAWAKPPSPRRCYDFQLTSASRSADPTRSSARAGQPRPPSLDVGAPSSSSWASRERPEAQPQPCLGQAAVTVVTWLPIYVPATPNLRYQKALDSRRWTSGGCSFLLLSAHFLSSCPACGARYSESAWQRGILESWRPSAGSRNWRPKLLRHVTAWAIPRALWAAPRGAARHNQLWRAIKKKPFQCSDWRNSSRSPAERGAAQPRG